MIVCDCVYYCHCRPITRFKNMRNEYIHLHNILYQTSCALNHYGLGVIISMQFLFNRPRRCTNVELGKRLIRVCEKIKFNKHTNIRYIIYMFIVVPVEVITVFIDGTREKIINDHRNAFLNWRVFNIIIMI